MICRKHPKYRGLRQPTTKLTKSQGCTCRCFYKYEKNRYCAQIVKAYLSSNISELNSLFDRMPDYGWFNIVNTITKISNVEISDRLEQLLKKHLLMTSSLY